ncbi:ZIP zinc transporter-domain-containing protein [Russula compacta]|nr:ZIP zinc transporter-domain-containing protein [Russula compacta]
MAALPVLLVLSGLLGLASFGIGILPLSFTFSSMHMSKLSSLGTGLLLGAALGVIIPEGIEALALAHSRRLSTSTALEGASIALPLLFGFTFMLVVEQLSSSHAHQHPARRLSHHPDITSPDSVFDVELAGFEDEPSGLSRSHTRRASGSTSVPKTSVESDAPPSAYPITIGLVMHGLADGLALGMSVLSSDNESSPSYGLSLVVFMALAVHKAPTALAYTVSLMSTSLSRMECRKHLLLFSASTPIGAIASYASFSVFGTEQVDGVGTALLISVSFCGRVLHLPVSRHDSSSEGVGTKMRIMLLVLGIFTPFMLGTLLDHGHDHGTISVSP